MTKLSNSQIDQNLGQGGQNFKKLTRNLDSPHFLGVKVYSYDKIGQTLKLTKIGVNGVKILKN
jgi:hypothetical protein